MQTNNLLDNPDNQEEEIKVHLQWSAFRSWSAFFVIGAFLVGVGSGYLIRGGFQQPEVVTRTDLEAQGNSASGMAAFAEQVNPAVGYNLNVSYGELGPQILSAGGIDYSAFVSLYESSGRPLTPEQVEILTEGTDQPVVINAENAYFLLNFFWAVGLVNENTILTEGPITQYSEGQIERFASTGGWTLGAKPVTDLFASQVLIPLTPEQQARVEEAAALIYRPCCNNPTLFPDCNHGMAMLGLLELMASQDTSLEEMLEAAKYVNAFWFPQQALETAIFLEETQSTSFRDVDPALVVGKEMHSGSGFAAVHQYLQANGLLAQTPGNGSSCAN